MIWFFVFCICAIIIFYAMIGYPCLLKFINAIKKPMPIKKDRSLLPIVSYMIVAHNEEKVIKDKLNNTLELDYPVDKFQIIVASDKSTDATNSIVNTFIDEHPERNIVLYNTVEHKGKTNAQNEAQKIATGEILVMTDANTIIEKNAIRELVSCFVSKDIVYVCGKLEYINTDENATSKSEATYWDLDLSMRDIESRIHTITAGNGALYACRNKEYIDFNPISCHDSIMPYTYSKAGKRAIFNPDAIAKEKAGETDSDEFKRKVRMNRDILSMLKLGFGVLNIFKYRWFALFYFGHRTCRYSLWWAHILLLLSAGILAVEGYIFGTVMTILQLIFWCLAIIANVKHSHNRILHLIGYYGMTVFAQFVGVINILTGKAKPVWQKAESTR